MLALRAAMAAYRDGWTRTVRAPRLLAALAGAVALVVLAGSAGTPGQPFLLDVFAPLGTALTGGALAAALEAADVSGRLGGETAPWALWVVVAVAGVVLTGGAMDRYARQRPLDARAFWGVSGELAFRLVRLGLIGGAIFSLFTGVLLLVLDAIAARALDGGAYVYELPAVLEVVFGAVYLAAAVVIFAATDCARVRLVVERRHSAVFALAAGARFAKRHLGQVVVLYGMLFTTAGAVWGLFSAAVWLADPPAEIVRVLDAGRAAAAVTVALVSCAAAVALFQASLAHARYVAPPPLIWPDSPAIETIGGQRDFPPAV